MPFHRYLIIGLLLSLPGTGANGATPPVPATSWEVREIDHPVMGVVTVAVPQSGVTTDAGDVKIVSAAFVSCEKARHTISIELANSVESDTKGGLQPIDNPRLVCNVRVNGSPVRTEISARWVTNELGDALARGLSPAELRRCNTIEMQQNVALPAGSATRGQRMTMSLYPGEAGLEKVFAGCAEPLIDAAPSLPQRPGLAAASAPKAVPVAPKAAAAAPPPVAAAPKLAAAATKPAPAADASWQPARTVTSGKTNVRASPKIDGALVTQLYPGTPVLAQRAESDWWRVKPTQGAGFAGFIREDRLAFERGSR